MMSNPALAQSITDADPSTNTTQTTIDSDASNYPSDTIAQPSEAISQLPTADADNPSSDGDASALSDEEIRSLTQALEADTQANAQTQTSTSSASIGQSIMAAVQSMNPDMALTADFALAWFSEKTNYQTGAHDPTSTGFQLQQLEMTLGASVDHIFRMDVNLVFSLSGVELEEAYATTLGLPWNLQLRAGQFLSRFGRINPTHPHTWDFVDQPFVIGKFYGAEGNRGPKTNIGSNGFRRLRQKKRKLSVITIR